VVRAYGEAVDAATRVALGEVHRKSEYAAAQQAVTDAVTARLIEDVDAMQNCVFRASAKTARSRAATDCFGRLVSAKVELAVATPRGRHALVITPELLRQTRGCAAESADTACLSCTTWRNAVRAVSTLLGEEDPPTRLDLEPARRGGQRAAQRGADAMPAPLAEP
jgi:hypothetical protein